MRVSLVIYGSLDSISGGYLYDRVLVEYLRSRGDQVKIVSLPRRNYPSHLSDNLRPSLLKSLLQGKWDLLLQDELNHPSLFWLNRRLQGRVEYPIVTIVHHLRCCEVHPKWRNLIYRLVEKQYLESVDGFIFNSRSTQLEVEKLVGEGKPSVVASPGRDRLKGTITREQIVERCGRPGPLQILFLGNVIPRKGLHTLLKGLSSLPAETWQLEVVGNTGLDLRYTEMIKRQVGDRGLSHRVSFKGLLSDDEVIESLSRSHLLAVPSSYEGFGIIYLEAMGFGLPVIASGTGGAVDLITHGREGALVKPGDFAAVAEFVEMLGRNRDQLLRMSLRSFERRMAFPTWAQTAERIRNFLLRQI